MLRIGKLPRRERLRLLEFVCSFAWADLEITPKERAFVARLLERAHLPAEDAAQVRSWLKQPPSMDEVDPARIPQEHRELFVQAAREMVQADDQVGEEERELLSVFEALLR